MKDKNFYQAKYNDWWLGRLVRTTPGFGRFKRVVRVEVIGSRSYVYGCAFLHFADGSSASVQQGESYRPKKSDVEVKAEHCHADRDGECSWKHCPQNRDGEPGRSGRHCPLDKGEDEEL